MDEPLLIGDIGGTNARFAIADRDVPGFAFEQTYKCADFATVADSIRYYLDHIGAPSPRVICLAVAGPVINDQVVFTNNPWMISVDELCQTFAIKAARLLNDFEAISHSLPHIPLEQVLSIGHLQPQPFDSPQHVVAVIGPGTGLGAVGLIKCKSRFITLAGESSHGGFAPETEEQIAILTVLRKRFDRVSSERLVSGPGLENLYWALAQIHGENRDYLSASQILSASINGSDSMADKTVKIFFQILGQVAGDLALTMGASNGIYIAGGIAQRYPEQITGSRFRDGFESKGRHRMLMERIPTQLVMHKQPGLLGASIVAQAMASDD